MPHHGSHDGRHRRIRNRYSHARFFLEWCAERGLTVENATNVDYSGLHLEVATGQAIITRPPPR